jgi:hypothetical protein
VATFYLLSDTKAFFLEITYQKFNWFSFLLPKLVARLQFNLTYRHTFIYVRHLVLLFIGLIWLQMEKPENQKRYFSYQKYPYDYYH